MKKKFFNFFQFFEKILSQIGLKYFLRHKKIKIIQKYEIFFFNFFSFFLKKLSIMGLKIW